MFQFKDILKSKCLFGILPNLYMYVMVHISIAHISLSEPIKVAILPNYMYHCV